MKNFKKDVGEFLSKNNIKFKEGTFERRRQDFLAYREKKLQEQDKPREQNKLKKPIQPELF